jgi:hypothetical protein
MAGKSDYLETHLLNAVFGTGTFTEPANIYVSLHTADPTDAGSGTEASGGGYARVSTATNGTDWTVTGNAATNGVAVTFPVSTGAISSGSALTHFGLWDASTAGNLLYAGALGTSRTVSAAGVTLSFAAGDIDVTED